MCGIAGLQLKNPGLYSRLGELIVPMLDVLASRGPDSTGVAVYRHDVPAGRHKYSLRAPHAGYDWAGYVSALEGAAAVYAPEGKKEVRGLVDFYLENARIVRDGLQAIGLTVYGGTNAPYIWVKTPDGMTSWQFFDTLLSEAHVVSTPASGFGPSGEGYLRLTAFGSREQTEEAVERIRTKLAR